ncbi:MAG: DUF6449 domain-containing protein [Lachnospiraceae bacterium]|nr:DUF6449 domain-containing protein [Lachnospiraceae bacterium]
MTSKKSSSDFAGLFTLMRENLKRRLWPIALSILGCLFALPIYTLLNIGSFQEDLALLLTTLPEVQAQFFGNILSFANIPVLLLSAGLALVNGLQGMLYLHSRVKGDMYGALPVKRVSLFDAAYVNGILIFAIPYLAAHLLSAGIGASRGFVTGGTFAYGLLCALIVIVFYTCMYTLVVLASVGTGNTVVALMGAFVLTIGGLVYGTLLYICRTVFFVTYYEPGHYSFLKEFAFTSPFAALGTIISSENRLMKDFTILETLGIPGDVAATTIVYLIVTVILYILCRKLIMKRPSEAAGKAIAFPASKPFIKVFLLIPAALFGALAFRTITNGKMSWFVFGFFGGLLITHAVAEIIFEFDFKACFKRPVSLCAGAGIAAVIALCFIFDVFGYDSYLPRADQVASVGLSVNGLQSRLEYGMDTADLGLDMFRYYPSNFEVRMERMALSDSEAVQKLAGSGIENAKSLRMDMILHAGNTEFTPPVTYEDSALYDELATYGTTYYHYRMNNGREIYRQYLVNYCDEEMLSALSEIYAEDAFKEAVFPELTAKNDTIGTLYYEDPRNSIPFDETPQQIDNILDTYRSELRAQTLESLKEEYPVGCLVSRVYNQEYHYYDSQYYMYIYPSFEKTIALLEQAGFSPLTTYESDEVEQIDAYCYMDDYSMNATFEEKDEIREIMPHVIYDEYYSMNWILQEDQLKQTEPVVYLDAYYRNGNNSGSSRTYFMVSYRIRNGECPPFVMEVLEESKE